MSLSARHTRAPKFSLTVQRQHHAHPARDYDPGDIATRAMQAANDIARREIFDRIEGRPTLKIAGPQGGPIETVSYDLKKLSAEKIKTIRAILAEAVIAESEPD